MTKCQNVEIGASPAKIKWNVVRGDTAKLLVEFLENDEETLIDISDWDFEATAYNPSTNLSDELEIEIVEGKVYIVAQDSITEQWGQDFGMRVAILNFDLQVRTEEDIVWTPIVGTISVIGDVTGVL
jgi:hypothetical protein